MNLSVCLFSHVKKITIFTTTTIFVIVLLLPIVAFAQSTVVLDDIIVTGTSVPVLQSESGNTVKVITNNEIKEKNPDSLLQLLETISSLTITTTGPSNYSIGMRGAANQNTLVLVDGVPFTDASGLMEIGNLALIPVSNIERIEILTGPASALYGSGATGGVINIITNQKATLPLFEVMIGSDAEYKINTNLRFGSENNNLLFTLSYHDDKNFNITSEKLGAKEDDPYYVINTGLTHRYKNEVLKNTLSFNYANGMFNLDNSGSDAIDFKSRNKKYSVYNVFGLDVFKIWKPTLTLSYANTERLYYDDPASTPNNYEYESQTILLDFNNNFPITDKINLVAGINYNNDKVVTQHTFADIDEDRTKVEGYFHTIFKPTSEWNIAGGIRYADVDGFNSKTTFSTNTAYKIPAANLTLKASAGTGYVAPTVFQLYAPVMGNRNLKAEQSRTWEAGFEHNVFDTVIWGASYFDTKYNDLIEWVGSGYSMADGEVSTKGVDTFFKAYITERAVLAGSYTFVDTEKDDNGVKTHLKRRPKNIANLSLTVYPINELSLTIDAKYRGESKDSSHSWPPVETTLGSYVLLNASARYTYQDKGYIFLRLLNITDKEYETAYGYANKGFTAQLGIGIGSADIF